MVLTDEEITKLIKQSDNELLAYTIFCGIIVLILGMFEIAIMLTYWNILPVNWW